MAVVLYRYVDVPALGPLPAMYEPVWFTEKSLSAVAEAVAAIAAALGILQLRRRLPRACLFRRASPLSSCRRDPPDHGGRFYYGRLMAPMTDVTAGEGACSVNEIQSLDPSGTPAGAEHHQQGFFPKRPGRVA